MTPLERADAMLAEAKDRAGLGQGPQADDSFRKAVELYRLALEDAPEDIAVLFGLATSLFELGRGEEAVPYLEAAIRLAPDRPALKARLVEAYYASGRHEHAFLAAEQLLKVHPDNAVGLALYARCLAQRSDFDGALDAFDRAVSRSYDAAVIFITWLADRRGGCDWREFDRTIEFISERLARGTYLSAPLDVMMTSNSAADVASSSRIYAKYYPARPALPVRTKRRSGPIRIGYFSADLRSHPVGRLMAPLLERHDPDAVEVTAFHWVPAQNDPMHQRIMAAVDHQVDAAEMSDEQLAKAVHEREIDVLVDLSGYTGGHRTSALAHRPAPVQVGFLGFPGGTSLPYMDYLIADKTVLPPHDLVHYDEKIAWMPDCYQPTDDKALISPVPPTRTQEGLPQGAFVFAAFAQATRLTPTIFEVWMRILQQVPNGVLWLSGHWEIPRANLRNIAASHGVNPNRLVFAGLTDTHADHLARHRLADLALSTFPYGAHSTSTEAMWVGLPIITCRGETFPSRVCARHLEIMGLQSLITDNLADYEALAVSLARDPRRLEKLRKQIKAERRGPLFDTTRFVRHLESAYRTMHERHMAGLAPETFSVTPLRTTRR